MRKLLSLIVLIVCLLASTDASAKKLVTVPRMYMFGMAAVFTDTIVHFTPVQQVDSAWIDSKSKFLQSRDSYSYQLRNYLATKEQMPHRTCIVVYAQNEKKLLKKYEKMKQLYTNPKKKGARHYDVRYIADTDFHFTTIDETPYIEEEKAAEEEAKASKNNKKKKRGK